MLQVHERTLQGDFLMALLKDILVARRAAGRPLKVQPLLCGAFREPYHVSVSGSCHGRGSQLNVWLLALP